MRKSAAVLLACLCAVYAGAQGPAPAAKMAVGGRAMHAVGTFEVKIVPAEPSPVAKEAETGRMTIDKVWRGALTGTSKGEMLTGITKENSSMAYVAMERVTATLDGRTGTFLFRHTAVMQSGDAGSAVADIAVVPNSGTGGLLGISGALTITQAAGVHHYDFAYSLPGQQ